MRTIVGIDIGATNLRIALAEEGGEILKQSSERTDGVGLMDQIYSKLDSFEGFDGIGIASVGPLNSRTGIITKPPNIKIRNLKIVDLLKEKYDRPCYLLNDCVASVLAEKMFGIGKRIDNLVYITLSTGIGCGVIVDGRVILGKDGNAHEVGHYTLDTESSVRCGCGGYGHWEAYCSGKNMPNFARFLLRSEYNGAKTALKARSKELTSELIFRLARSDRVAFDIVSRVCKMNAIAIANIVNAYDPELITIGGSIALNNQRSVMGAIRNYVGDYSINRLPKISITPLGERIGINGAIAGFIYCDEQLVIN